MSTLQQRAEARRQKATITKLNLHSEEHNSFHTHLNLEESWELLAKISKEKWIEETGEIPSSSVDKTQYKVISLSEK